MSDEAKATDSGKRKRLAWGLGGAAVVLGGLAVAGLLGAFTPIGHTEEALRAGEQAEPRSTQSNPSTSTADQVTTRPEVQAQQASTEEKPAAPEATNCYDNDWLRVVLHEKATPETRREFAGILGPTLADKGVRVTAAGEDAQFLLFTSDSDNADQLKDAALPFEANGSAKAKANVCLKGFSETQFIVRDANMNQHLLLKGSYRC